MDFESSSQRTPKFTTFTRTFKRELKQELEKNFHITQFVFNVGHFYCSGFFETPDTKKYYFSISDVRGGRTTQLLLRTAKSFTDYTGGSNTYITIKPNMFKDYSLPKL